jgi:hypothetical protein
MIISSQSRKKLTLIGVVGNTGVTGSVGAGESDQAGRGSAATSSDLELMTSRVELHSRVTTCRVEGNELVANEVVAGLDARWDGVVDSAVASLHQGAL